jgi:hypothetical protein
MSTLFEWLARDVAVPCWAACIMCAGGIALVAIGLFLLWASYDWSPDGRED